jgi:hypothetical protein
VQAGALTVRFFGFAPSTPNYNIIQLTGDASAGYSTALVYSCSNSNNGPQVGEEPGLSDSWNLMDKRQ